MCNCTSGMRRLAQARNPYSLSWLWIPGSRFARPGMTTILLLARSRLDLHILEIARLVVDPELGRRNPGGELADPGDRNHQGSDEIAVIGGRKPFALSLVPGRIVDQHAVRRSVNILELADLAMERDVRQRQLEVVAGR